MKTRLSVAVLLGLCASGVAQAALYDRGGGLIYDSVLNVTWLQDANYAKTSGYDGDGGMTWANALAWADQLQYYDSVRGVTWSDWRLPAVRPINGSEFNYSWSSDGSSDYGCNISAPGSAYPGATASELAYMYYNNLLGNEPFRNPDGSDNPAWTGEVSASFVDAATGEMKAFMNLVPDLYWSEYAPGLSRRWFFGTNYGVQVNAGSDEHSELYAWVVRPGDVAAAVVPLPAGLPLFLTALASFGLFGARRRQ